MSLAPRLLPIEPLSRRPTRRLHRKPPLCACGQLVEPGLQRAISQILYTLVLSESLHPHSCFPDDFRRSYLIKRGYCATIVFSANSTLRPQSAHDMPLIMEDLNYDNMDDDLFGDSVQVTLPNINAMPAPPPVRGLAGRLDELSTSGCCSYVACICSPRVDSLTALPLPISHLRSETKQERGRAFVRSMC